MAFGAVTGSIRKMIRNAFIAVALSLSILSPAWGQDFQKGDEAYKRGDYAAAMREWRPLAQKGDANAQFMLGKMYWLGQGAPKDFTEAARWIRLAAEQGLADAQHSLGIMYGYGEGVLEDLVYAYMWSNLASAQGKGEAMITRPVFAKKMTREQIAEAQRLSRECLAQNYKGC